MIYETKSWEIEKENRKVLRATLRLCVHCNSPWNYNDMYLVKVHGRLHYVCSSCFEDWSRLMDKHEIRFTIRKGPLVSLEA